MGNAKDRDPILLTCMMLALLFGAGTISSMAWARVSQHNQASSKQTPQEDVDFLALAATAMRRILMNAARDRGREKRGGGWERITLGTAGSAERNGSIDPPSVSLIDLDDALRQLEETSESYVRLVELRYFAGLSLEETAQVLGVSDRTVAREWAKARAWLQKFLRTPA